MKGNFDALVGLAGICIGFIGIGYAFGTRKKMNDICDKLDKSIDELSDSTEVHIPDYLIQQAINHAVNREARDAARKATDKVIADIETTIKSEVSSAVTSERDKIADSVKKEIEKKVANIDIASLRREVVSEAKEATAEKLDDSMEEILEKFNDELHSISKIYKSIEKAITKEKESGTVLRIS